MEASYDFSQAPKDRNILIKTRTFGYTETKGWLPTGFQWIECRWYVPKHSDGEGPRWVEWCGNKHTMTTGRIDPIAWCELPKEK